MQQKVTGCHLFDIFVFLGGNLLILNLHETKIVKIMKNHVVNVVHMLSRDVLYKACKGIFLYFERESRHCLVQGTF